ncbi:MAG TPA: phenylalanine 4-monooxygenase, partial [Hyphomonas sp.]|nr:phenylalanine 4-monooxygenase [Hyphomonas sp.]
IYGAGILSSPNETVFALEDDSPNRVAFDLQRIMRTKYIIDDFQQTYFVIDSFDALLDACYQDFGGVYDEVKSKPDIEAHETLPGDALIHRGSLDYFRQKAQV